MHPKMTHLPQAFQHLTNLHVEDLPELESVPDQLRSLSMLFVKDFPKIVSIPVLPNLKSLTALGCPQLEMRYQRGRGDDWRRSTFLEYNSTIFC